MGTTGGVSCRNTALELVLTRAGLSVEQLADQINSTAAQLQLRVTVHRRHPKRWITPDKGRAQPSIPRVPIPGLACEVLSLRLGEPVTPTMLGWPNADPHVDRWYAKADDGLSQSWDARGVLDSLVQVVDPGPVERRHFLALTGVSLTSVAHQWLFDPDRVAASLRGDRVTAAVVDDLGRVADGLRRVDDSMGGGTLFPAVRENLRLMVALLNNSSYTEAVGRNMYALAAEFARLAGWVSYDGGNEGLAQRYWIVALRSAHLSGDRAVGANVLAFMSIAAKHSARPRDAADLANSALRWEGALTPAVAGSLYLRLAEGAAKVGDAYTSKRAQDRASESLRRTDPEGEPSWIYWFNQAELDASIGQAALRLGQFADAGEHLRAAVAGIGPSFTRQRAFIMCDLAEARLGAGSVEQACATAAESATAIRRLNSKPDRARLAAFRQALTPYATSTAVRELDDKHGDLFTIRT
jgi:tetratricopeptide (TPR) repeat protein